MYWSTATSLVGLLAAGASAQLMVCNADNCLRAVRATNFPSRQQECTAYLVSTVTPEAVTVTITNTEYVSATTTEGAILTTTVHDTLTVTEPLTATTQVPPVTATAISFNPNLLRRQTAGPAPIPVYASACSNVARYSSACACVVASASTTVLEPATVTSYATEVVSVTETATETTSTETQTVFDITTTLTTIVATETDTAVATTTMVHEVPLRQGFAIRAIRTYPSELFLGYVNPASNNQGMAVLPTPYKFWLDDQGRLTSASGFAGVQRNSDFTVWNVRQGNNSPWQPHKPTINPADLTLENWSTSEGPYTVPFWSNNANDKNRQFYWVHPTVPVSAPRNVGWVDVVFKAEGFSG